MTPEHDAERLRLAARIMTLSYPQRNAAWLKVEPVASVDVDAELWVEGGVAGLDPASARDRCVQVFLQDHFNQWTPEDSAYSIFLQGTWRPVARDRMMAELDRLFAAAEAARSRAAADEAAERAEAEAGGYGLGESTPVSPGPFEDDAALRRWFSTELWPGPGPRWFVFEPAPRQAPVPAVIAIDALLVGVLWVAQQAVELP